MDAADADAQTCAVTIIITVVMESLLVFGLLSFFYAAEMVSEITEMIVDAVEMVDVTAVSGLSYF